MQSDFKLLPLTISLVAGLVVSVIMIFKGNNTITSVIWVLCVLLVFYILGLIFRTLLISFRTKEEEKNNNSQDEVELEDVTSDNTSDKE